MASYHEDLVVWQKADKLTLDIYAVTRGFPREETYGLVAQLKRAVFGRCHKERRGCRPTASPRIHSLRVDSQGFCI